MTFKKSEKEIIKAIVKYGEKDNSMAKVLNKSQLLDWNVGSQLARNLEIWSIITSNQKSRFVLKSSSY